MIANELYFHTPYEINEFAFLRAVVPTSQHFVDIGANTGIFSIFCSKCNPEINTVAVEPHPSNFERLKCNLFLNNMSTAMSFQLGVGSANGKALFTIPADESISATSSFWGGFSKFMHNISFKEIEVDLVTLDDLLADVPLTFRDVLKVDVEYYELEVLKGATSTLTVKRPMLLIEILQFDESNFSADGRNESVTTHGRDIVELLKRFDYSCFAVLETGIKQVHELAGNDRNFVFLPISTSVDYYTFAQIREGVESNNFSN